MESTTQMLVLEDDSSSGMVAVLSCVNTFYNVFTYHHKIRVSLEGLWEFHKYWGR